MNRILTTAGLAALSAASIIPSSAQELTTSTKPWAINATLRGFYDDNYFTYPGTAALPKKETFGFDVSPSVSYNLKRDNTTIGASYQYGFRYFFDRERPRDDQSHQVNLKLSQAFSERYNLDIKDSFVIAQEPSVLDPDISRTVPARSEGDNVRNSGGIQFGATVMENFSLLAGYNNTLYDYEQDAEDVMSAQAAFRAGEIAAGRPDPGPGVVNGIGSRSAVLDRMEHAFNLDGNYQLLPQTLLSLGYIYGISDYTSDDLINATTRGSERDLDYHVVTLGVRQQFNPQLAAALKGGVQITTFDSSRWDDETNPYVDGSVTWTYANASSVQAGVIHKRTPTDVNVLPNGELNSDSETTSFYVSLNHQIFSKFSANLLAQYQHATFNGDVTGATGGTSDDLVDNLFYASISFTYQFTRNIAAEAGYSYDRLDSDLVYGGTPRSFTRNRVWVGTRLSY